MKKLILIACLTLAATTATAQDLTTGTIRYSVACFKDTNYIMLIDDSVLVIYGDTVAVLRELFRVTNLYQEKYYDARGVLDYIDLSKLASIYRIRRFTEAVKRYNKSKDKL